MTRGLGRIRESIPRPRPCALGLGRVEELVPRPSPCARGLGRGGEPVPHPLWHGASGGSENRYLVRGLVARGLGRVGELVPRPRPCGAGPWTSRRIGTSSEASWFHSGPSPLRVSPDIVRGGPGGPAGPRIRWGFAGGCLLASIFTRSKRFFRFLLRRPLFMVSDTLYEVS